MKEIAFWGCLTIANVYLVRILYDDKKWAILLFVVWIVMATFALIT